MSRLRRPVRVCPQCSRPLEWGWACFACRDGVCGCGRFTGSCLISTCWACQAAGLSHDNDPDAAVHDPPPCGACGRGRAVVACDGCGLAACPACRREVGRAVEQRRGGGCRIDSVDLCPACASEQTGRG